MSLSGRNIWIDIEQPKAAIMFNSLIKQFQEDGVNLLITARDYDSTFQILDDHDVDYIKVGKHGGASLEEKLKTHIKRLKELFSHIVKFNPDYLVNFISVEAIRIAYGLQIPSIGFNDEPRNEPVCKLIFPFIDKLITPKCIPKESYIELYADPKKIIRYNGIDEIGWLSGFKPDSSILADYDLHKGNYVIMRSEPSAACYFINKLKPDETMLSEIFPPIYKEFPNHKYFLLARSRNQEEFLRKTLKKYEPNPNLIITRYLPNLDDFCFYSGLVISGGGTIVRESSLLSVPSIEFFPGPTAPQEMFLRNNGFPLEHIEELDRIIDRSIHVLNQGFDNGRIKSFKKKINQFENPVKICYNYVRIHI
ncbi:MAG: DUF354 domain-containing protein [Candidatus Lokiarchaeota archaeon]|nr:DUF354 domain-containing protein [Candidatus Lokiarchaeota archaeon]